MLLNACLFIPSHLLFGRDVQRGCLCEAAMSPQKNSGKPTEIPKMWWSLLAENSLTLWCLHPFVKLHFTWTLSFFISEELMLSFAYAFGLYVCVCTGAHMRAHIHVCSCPLSCVWRPEVSLGCSLQSLFLFRFRDRFHHWTWNSQVQLDWLAREIWGSTYPHPTPSSGIIDTSSVYSFSVRTEVRTHDLAP